jgi:hypothetical protein
MVEFFDEVKEADGAFIVVLAETESTPVFIQPPLDVDV